MALKASKMFKIFVYGTLKRGEPNHYLMSGGRGTTKLLAEAKLSRRYPLVVDKKNGIPFMLPEEGRGEVGLSF